MSRVRVLLNSPINRARSPSPRPTWLLRLLVLAILRSHPPVVLLSLFLRHAARTRTAPCGSRRGPFIFYHRASSPLARLRVPPRSSFAPSSGSAKFIAASPPRPPASPPLPLPPLLLFLPEHPSIRPVERGAKISARLPDDSTASSPLVSAIFFPPRENFFSLPRLSSLGLFAARAPFCSLLLPFPFSRSDGRYYFCGGIPSDRSCAYHRCRTTGRNLHDNG